MDEDSVTVGRLPGGPDGGWSSTIVPDGDDVIVTLIPPEGYYPEIGPGPDYPILIYHDVTFNSGAHGTFAGGSVTPITERVRRNTVLVATDVPTVNYDAGRPFAGWTPSNPVGHEVVGSITFTAIFDGDIVVDADYNDEGGVDVELNIPDTDYEVTVDDDIIIVRIPDADEDDVSVGRLPGGEDGGWDYNIRQSEDGDDVIVELIPPPGYYIRQPGGPGTDIYVYHNVTFNPGAHGTFAGSTTPITELVRRNTVLVAADVPTVNYDAGRPFAGWTPSNPVDHEVVGSITFTAIFDGDIIVDADYNDDGGVDVELNIPDEDYEVTVDDDKIIIRIPDADEDDVTVGRLPGGPEGGWDFDIDQEDDDVIVTLIPPPGYYIRQPGGPDSEIYIYHVITFYHSYGVRHVCENGVQNPLTVRRGTNLYLAGLVPSTPTRTVTHMIPVLIERDDEEDEDEYYEEDVYYDEDDYVVDEDVVADDETIADEDDAVSEDDAVEDGEEAVVEDDTDDGETYVPAEPEYTEGSTDTEDLGEFSLEYFELVPMTEEIDFLGWFTQTGVAFNFNEGVTASHILTAQWYDVQMHTVTFVRNYANAAEITPVEVADGGLVTAPSVSRAGFTLAGWFTAPTGGVRFDFNTPIVADITLYARWTPIGGNGGGWWTPPVVELPEEEVPLAEWDGIHHAFLIGFAEDGTVRPRAEATRAQVATILFRLMSDTSRATHWRQSNPFSDVVITNWYNNAVSTTVNAGVFRGMPDGTFMPDRSITRAELAATIVRFMGVTPNNGSAQFNDIAGHWAHGYINAAALNGWVMGDNGLGNQFRPNDTITRAELAAIVNRAFERLPSGPEDLLPGMRTWPDNANPNAWYFLYIQEATNSHYYLLQDDGIHETWVEMLAQERPWALLERPDSSPNDIFAGAVPPIGVVPAAGDVNENKSEDYYEYNDYDLGDEDDADDDDDDVEDYGDAA